MDVHGKELLSIRTRPTAPDRVVAINAVFSPAPDHVRRQMFSIKKSVEGVEGK